MGFFSAIKNTIDKIVKTISPKERKRAKAQAEINRRNQIKKERVAQIVADKKARRAAVMSNGKKTARRVHSKETKQKYHLFFHSGASRREGQAAVEAEKLTGQKTTYPIYSDWDDILPIFEEQERYDIDDFSSLSIGTKVFLEAKAKQVISHADLNTEVLVDHVVGYDQNGNEIVEKEKLSLVEAYQHIIIEFDPDYRCEEISEYGTITKMLQIAPSVLVNGDKISFEYAGM